LTWTYTPPAAMDPAAPIVAAETLFASGSDGAIRSLCTRNGEVKWSAYTGGAVVFPPVAYAGRLYVGSADGWVYCFDAQSGRQRWRFRAAPLERKIPIYGKLCSTWPVGSGVLVDQGVVYAAAGVANYDGTHVYALDAETGKIRWQNNTSGRLGGVESLAGVSVQGHLLLHAGKLYLAGGNAVSPAVYDLRDGRCLSEFHPSWQTRSCPHGQDLFLIHDQVCCFDRRLYGPNRYWPSRGFVGPLVLAQREDMLFRDLGGGVARVTAESAGDKKPKPLWQSRHLRQTYALALGADALIAAGQWTTDDQAAPSYALAALSTDKGAVLWSRALPAQPAWWGLALDNSGRIFLSLTDGRTLCFTANH
jgi:outer membrane protein assembly factor BamB